MKIVKPPFSIRLIYWLTNFALVTSFLVLVASILFNVVLYTGFFGSDVQLHTQLPVKVDFLETGNLSLNGQDVTVELVEATTKIHFHNTPDYITRRVGIAIIIVAAIASYLTWIFRVFMRNVKNGVVFSKQNITLLKRLAYILAAGWFLTAIYMHLFNHYVAKHLEFVNVRITDDIIEFEGLAIVALFIWVLAHIFSTGLRLQEEKDLTI